MAFSMFCFCFYIRILSDSTVPSWPNTLGRARNRRFGLVSMSRAEKPSFHKPLFTILGRDVHLCNKRNPSLFEQSDGNEAIWWIKWLPAGIIRHNEHMSSAGSHHTQLPRDAGAQFKSQPLIPGPVIGPQHRGPGQEWSSTPGPVIAPQNRTKLLLLLLLLTR